MEAATGNLVATWAAEAPLTKAVSTGANQVLASSGKGRLFLLEASLEGLRVVVDTDLAVEVACIDVSPWPASGAPRPVFASGATALYWLASTSLLGRRLLAAAAQLFG